MALFFIVVKRLNNVNVDNFLACFTSAQTFFSLLKTPPYALQCKTLSWAALVGKSLAEMQVTFENKNDSCTAHIGKNNRFPFLDILGNLKNTHKNPKFGRVRQVPIRELGWEFPGWDLSHFAKFGIFMGII